MEHHPDTLVELTTAGDEFEADAIVAELASRDIVAKAFTAATPAMRFHVGPAIRIDVRRGDLEAAAAALQSFRATPIVCDWDAVNTGDTSPLSKGERAAMSSHCASCGCELPASPAPDQRCPACGTSFAEKPPLSLAQVKQALEARGDRMVKWSLGIVGGLVLLVILYMTFASFVTGVT